MSTSSTDLSTLKKLIALCKKSGVQAVKMGDIELSFLPYAQKTKAVKGKTSDYIPTEGGITDEQALFWSSPNVGMNG